MEHTNQLLSKVKAEIEKTGFPLEMRVAKLLLKRGYVVRQSIYYLDENEGKPREMDIMAHHNSTFVNDFKETVYVRNYLVIECKKNNDKPWVFLSSEKNEGDPNLKNIFLYPFKPSLVPLFQESIITIGHSHPYVFNRLLGRSYFEAFKSGNEANEMIFKAVSSVTKATIYFDKDKGNMHNICFYYPVIVVSGELFEATLNDENDVNVKQVDSVLLSYHHKSANEERNFLIQVIKEKTLEKYLNELESTYEVVSNEVESRYHLFNID